MKKLFLAFSFSAGAVFSFAQAPTDILKYSYFPQHGSARNVAIGGAMSSLGGDISSLYVNPAGLGLYKTSEIVVSPGFAFNNDKATFRGTSATDNKSAFDLGLTGFVIGSQSPYSSNKSEAFAIGINQIANFNNTLTYRGQNNYSSYSEQFTEEAQASGYDIGGILNDPAYAFGTSLALDTYLADTATINGQTLWRGAPENIIDNGGTLNQQKTVRTTGGIYEIALGFAANPNDKFYYGITVGLPLVSYTRNTYFREEDATGDANNGFAYSEWNDKYKTTGYGLNAKLGLLYKATDFVRLGLAVHTPTFYWLRDEECANMETDLDENNPYYSNSNKFPGTSGGIGRTDYLATTPWKVVAGGSYVLHESSDIKQQKGFITADVEYVTYASAKYKANTNAYGGDDSYYTSVNSVINNYYKGAFNFRLGGELKFNTWMVRLGGGYYGNPYADDALSSHITQLSGGLGYRNKGIFVDLTYAQIMNKDVNFPYRLQDKANTFATYTANRGNLMLTFGFKL